MNLKTAIPALHWKEQKFKQKILALYENHPDKHGFNCDHLLKMEIFFRYFYEEYFKVQVLGIENIPATGRTILIGNHSGVLPVDAFMLYIALLNKHSSPRRIRFLVHNWLLSVPGAGELIRSSGGVFANYKIAKELLENEEIVFFYPEGTKGTGKSFSMRYRLETFDPGFVKAAIETRTPIVPITTVGGDEIFPLLGNIKSVARLMNAPYWPMTPTHPWLPFSTSCMPLPVKLLIKIDKPVLLEYPPEQCHNRSLRRELSRNFQYKIQRNLNMLLNIRKSPFSDWDIDAIKNLQTETN